MEGYQLGGKGENGEKGAGVKYKLLGTNRQGDVKNSIGNGVAKNLYAQPMDMN